MKEGRGKNTHIKTNSRIDLIGYFPLISPSRLLIPSPSYDCPYESRRVSVTPASRKEGGGIFTARATLRELYACVSIGPIGGGVDEKGRGR